MTARAHAFPAPTGGTKGYEPLFRVLGMLPATSPEIAAALGCSVPQACVFVRRLRSVGLARQVGATQTRPVTPIWGCGDGRRNASIKAGIYAITIAAFFRAVAEPRSCAEIAEVLGISRPIAQKLVTLAKRERLCRIAEWDRAGGNVVAAWQVGSGPDARRPRPMSKREQNQRYWRAKCAKVRQMQLTRALAGAANDEHRRAAA